MGGSDALPLMGRDSMGLRRKQVPGCWAVTVLLGSLGLEFCRKETRPSGFRKSLICTLGSWAPTASGQAQMAQQGGGHRDGL